MKFLVAGGAGFIGSHICEKLILLNHEVVCLDNFYTSSKKNIKHLLDFRNFFLIKKDVTKKIKLEVDGIFNLACPASPKKYQYDPIYTAKISFYGNLNLLELATSQKIKYLFTSTSEIYGDPLEHPQKETYYGNVNCFGPRACYDEGKRFAETICYDFKKKFNTNIRIPRIFNTYGPRMMLDDGRVITNFIFNALKGQNIEIYGDGSQTRSFCYIEDMVKGLLKLFFSNKKNLDIPINIGNPTENSIKELADLVIDMTGSKSKIVYKKMPVNDPIRRKPDINKINKKLGWQPSIKLKDGLYKTISYIEKEI